MEARIFCSASKIVDTVTKFMEECDNFVMFEKRWFILGRLREVADESSSRISTSTIGIEVTRLKREVGGMTILSRTRMKI